MLTSQIREELRVIQIGLKKVFPASVHEIRELPGGGKKWVFLKWQTIRERLDEVAPEWQSDYSEVQYMGNDAICRCGITILGARKEAIASVQISITSSGGKEMTRGSAADRLAAEGLKNAAETWGVGRYLDDQPFTIRYLWEHMSELDDQMQGEVRRLSEQYKIQIGARQAPVRPKKEQGGLLEALAGVPIATPKPDRNLLNAEIESVMKRRDISLELAKEILFSLFQVRSRQQLTDEQLAQFLDYLKSGGPQAGGNGRSERLMTNS